VAWPAQAPAFRATPIPAVAHDELHDTASGAAEWRDASGWRWSGWWIRYHAGAAGKVVFESHNPALCLPAAGWRVLPGGDAFGVTQGSVRLSVQGRVFARDNCTIYVFWVPYLDRGTPAGADRAGGIYGHSLAALMKGNSPWLADVWNGCRGADAETLEVAVTGPVDYRAAKNAFRRVAAGLIQPDPALIAGGL
jgi:hypothetical protein